MKVHVFNKVSAITVSLIASACVYAWVKDGTSKGNGCCYDDKTGKYCGKAVDDKGNTLPSNKPCECGIFMNYQPGELDTLEAYTTSDATLEGGTTIRPGQVIIWPYVKGEIAKPIKVEGGKFSLPEGCTGLIASGFKMERGTDPSNPRHSPLLLQVRGERQSLQITASSSAMEPEVSVIKEGRSPRLVITGGVAPFRITPTVGRRRGTAITTMQREITLPNGRFDRIDVLDRNLRRVTATN